MHAMTTAALHILHAAGFTAVLADDDERPYELDVRASSLDAVNWHLYQPRHPLEQTAPVPFTAPPVGS
jgi:hypothetical protein